MSDFKGILAGMDWDAIGLTAGMMIFVLVVMLIVRRYRDRGGRVGSQIRSESRERQQKRLTSMLKRATALREVKVVDDVTIDVRNKVTIDAVIIGYYGVSAVIACDLAGDIYADDKSDKLTRVSPTGERTHIENPFIRANEAARELSELLRHNKMMKIPVEGKVFFTNPKANISIPSSVDYISSKNYKKVFSQQRYLEDKGTDTDKVYKLLCQQKG